MAAYSLSALLVAIYALCAMCVGTNSAAAHEPANAGHARGPTNGEAGLQWISFAPLKDFAAKGLNWIMPIQRQTPPTAPLPPTEEVPQGDSWEARFARGVHCSKLAVDAGEEAVGAWAVDRKGSGVGVPVKILEAEELLLAAEEAPAAKLKEKTAERALRVYNHAKWLAERNLARAAEYRYREAFRLAKQSKRSVLAAHALSRLGYFLMNWRRYEEAREVLRQSELLSKKSNPLAPYLHGVLERRAAGADAARLRQAEERILSSQEQPSDELESERQQLLGEIGYWRAAEASTAGCFETFDAAKVLICLTGHAVFSLR